MPNILTKEYKLGKLELKGWQWAGLATGGILLGLYIAKGRSSGGGVLGSANMEDPAFGEPGSSPEVGDIESVPYGFESDYGNSAYAYDPDVESPEPLAPTVDEPPATPPTSGGGVVTAPVLPGVPSGGAGVIRVTIPGLLPAGYHWVKYPTLAALNAHPGPARSQPGAVTTPRHTCPAGFHWNGFSCVPNR